MTDNRTPVHFAVDNNEDAARIACVLDALGYAPFRNLGDAPPGKRLAWTTVRMVSTLRLSDREALVLAGVLQGLRNEEIAADMLISRATVKWHLHNIFAKANVDSREALLLLALRDGDALPHKRPLHIVRSC